VKVSLAGCFHLANIYSLFMFLSSIGLSLNLFFHVAYIGFLQLFIVSLLSTFPPLQNPVKRVKGVELTVPIAYGTISFWLGKKAEE
jgi:hypothetical protein